MLFLDFACRYDVKSVWFTCTVEFLFELQRIAKLEEESVVELELDYDEEEEMDGPEEKQPAEDSDGEGGGKEAQEELRNNLKNLDFKDTTEDADNGGKKRSALATVSFSQAARGMNRQENRVKFKTDEGDGSENESGSASGSNRRGSTMHASTLPAPVQDPSFLGRRDSNFFEKVVPFIKGRRKKVKILLINSLRKRFSNVLICIA